MFKSNSFNFSQLQSQAQANATRRMISLGTMSAYKHTARLLACVLIICYGRQGTQCLQVTEAADAASTSTATGDAQTGPVGIAFPQNDKALLVAAGGRQLESTEDQYQKSSEEDEHWQSKRLRFEYPPSPSGQDLDAKEILRRYHIEQLLEALTGTIPPSPKKLRSSQRSALGEPAAAVVSSRASGQQIFRSGRTFPRGSLETNGGLVKQRSQSGSYDSSMLDGRSGLRNEAAVGGPTGIVWTETSDHYGGGKSRPSIAAKQPRSHSLEEQVSQKMLGELAVSDHRRTPLGLIYKDEQPLAGVRKSHRSGMEEIPIQTPIHSTHSGGDYETKRVENSRGWNNLRGMWGKRSTDAAENNRRLLEAQQQEGSGSLDATPVRSDDDGGGGGGGGGGTSFDHYMNEADKEQQTLASVMQSIRFM